jgi:hypothetical protein
LTDSLISTASDKTLQSLVVKPAYFIKGLTPPVNSFLECLLRQLSANGDLGDPSPDCSLFLLFGLKKSRASDDHAKDHFGCFDGILESKDRYISLLSKPCAWLTMAKEGA